MFRTKLFTSALLLALAMVSLPALAQEQPLSLFKDMVGKQWKGHYVNSSDSVIAHFIRWEYALDSKYVKQTKEVPELNFKMETFFFWDFELKQVSSLTLINRDMIARGQVKTEENKIALQSKTFKRSGTSESKQTFEINSSGQLEDYYFRKESDKWVEGHFILYNEINEN
jgi:hypothetical protein